MCVRVLKFEFTLYLRNERKGHLDSEIVKSITNSTTAADPEIGGSMIAVGGSEFDLASPKPCSTSISPDSKKESREDIGSSVKAFETDNVFARSFGRDAVIVLASEGLRCLFTYVDLPSFGYDVGGVESHHACDKHRSMNFFPMNFPLLESSLVRRYCPDWVYSGKPKAMQALVATNLGNTPNSDQQNPSLRIPQSSSLGSV